MRAIPIVWYLEFDILKSIASGSSCDKPGPHTMLIRPTREVDWPLLKHLRLAALRDAPRAFGQSYADVAAFSDMQWRALAAGREPPHFLLAFNGPHAIGMIGGVRQNDAYHLISMWVAPQARGSGTASRLIEKVKAHALERGERNFALRVAPDNAPAVALYRKHGFTFTETTTPLRSFPDIRVQTMVWQAKS